LPSVLRRLDDGDVPTDAAAGEQQRASAPPRPLCVGRSLVPYAMAAAASAMSSRTPRTGMAARHDLHPRHRHLALGSLIRYACSAPADATVVKHGEDCMHCGDRPV
jgi:hypothetical protein